MVECYKNPANGYVEQISPMSWLWCLIFGALYFAYKGIWTHVVVSLVLAPMTLGLSWLVYPFFARSIIENSYLRKGWIGFDREGLGINTLRHLAVAILASTIFSVIYFFVQRLGNSIPLPPAYAVIFINFISICVGITCSFLIFKRRHDLLPESKELHILALVQLVASIFKVSTALMSVGYLFIFGYLDDPLILKIWSFSVLVLIITSARITYWDFRKRSIASPK